MFSKILFFASTLFGFAAAAATTNTPPPAPIPAGECSTAPVQCCNTTEDGHDGWSHAAESLFGVLNIPVKDITGTVGLTCNPITGIGVGSAGCSATPVCCENNSYHGVVALGCVPVNLSL